jgi:hypothetical protein
MYCISFIPVLVHVLLDERRDTSEVTEGCDSSSQEKMEKDKDTGQISSNEDTKLADCAKNPHHSEDVNLTDCGQYRHRHQDVKLTNCDKNVSLKSNADILDVAEENSQGAVHLDGVVEGHFSSDTKNYSSPTTSAVGGNSQKSEGSALDISDSFSKEDNSQVISNNEHVLDSTSNEEQSVISNPVRSRTVPGGNNSSAGIDKHISSGNSNDYYDSGLCSHEEVLPVRLAIFSLPVLNDEFRIEN